MNRKDAPAEVKPLLDILDHYYATDPHACKCKHLVDKESIDTIVTELRNCYDIFYTPDGAEVEKDWKAESDKWEAMYRTVAAQLDRTDAALYSTETALKAMKTRVRKAEGTYIYPDDDDSEDYDDEVSAVEWKARYEAERKMRLELQSKVIALNTQLAAEKGILLG